MANPLLGQVLGSVLANSMRGRARSGPFGRAPAGGGGIGDLLGRGTGRSPVGGRTGGQGALVALLLPLAMQWIQRNGGVKEVLRRFEQKGFGPQANSWVSTGPNSPLKAEEIDEVIGGEELSQLSRKLGISEREVALGLADVLPEVVNQLSPEGDIPPEADDALDAGRAELERELTLADVHAPK
jgi:uncharacterized protein YidB (DUF937 family)